MLLAASQAEFADTKVNMKEVVVSEASPAGKQRGTDPSDNLRQTASADGI